MNMRSRRTTRQPPAQPITGLSTNTGPLATALWLCARGLDPAQRRWSIEITLAAADTRFALELYAEEWGFRFSHAGKQSWIRVTDLPFVHGRDDHGLIAERPPLGQIGSLIRRLEHRHGLRFDRKRAAIESSIADAEWAIRPWVEAL